MKPDIIPNKQPYAFHNFLASDTFLPTIEFTRASTKFKYRGSKVAAINEPVVELGKGFVADPSRTNIFTDGGLTGSGVFYTGMTGTPSSIPTPGYFQAMELNFAGYSNNHSYIRLKNIDRSAGIPYTVSFFIKPNSVMLAGGITFRWLHNPSTASVIVNFDFNTLTMGAWTGFDRQGTIGGVEKLDNGWYFIWLNVTSAAGEMPAEPMDVCFYHASTLLADSGLAYISTISVEPWSGRPTPIPASGGQVTRASEFFTLPMIGGTNHYIIKHNALPIIRRLHHGGTVELPVLPNSRCTVYSIKNGVIRHFSDGEFKTAISGYDLSIGKFRMAPWEQVIIESIMHHVIDLTDEEIRLLSQL